MILNSDKIKVIILGSTGTIGVNALKVIDAFPGKFKVTGLSCNQAVEELAVQARKYLPDAVAIADCDVEVNESLFPSGYSKIFRSDSGILEMIKSVDADIIINGIAGAKGLIPSVTAIECGKNLALANKESIVMAGPQLLKMARKQKVDIIPVDSEHSAIFNLIRYAPRNAIEKVILTASGGSIFNLDTSELKNVRVKDALNHPNWKMGKKITVDSATMANKGLEVIEAQHLFNIDLKNIEVLIHPQSIVHSLVKTRDGSLYAQIGQPDMKIPIQNALSYPEVWVNPFDKFDLTEKPLSFFKPDLVKYRMLAIAYEVAEAGGAYPIIYNAANEIAVEGFLKNRLSFVQIPELVKNIIEFEWNIPVATIEDILYIDREVRIKAKCIVDFKYS